MSTLKILDIPMQARLLATLVAPLITLWACHVEPASSAPKQFHYQVHGIHFDLPENWHITSEQVAPQGDSPLSIIVEGPHQALAIIDTIPGTPPSLEDFAKAFSSTTNTHIAQSNHSATPLPPVFEESGPDRIRERFSVTITGNGSMEFFREYHRIEGATTTAYLVVQGSSEDLPILRNDLDVFKNTFGFN